MNPELVMIRTLKAPPWSSVYTLKPEKRQIRASIKTHGVLSPVIAQTETNWIIDGKTRSEIALELGSTHIPVVFVECGEVEAMILHVQMNRYRGEVVARRLSQIIRRILVSGAYDADSLQAKLGMSYDEFDVLADGTILKQRKIPAHAYSAAWVPIESATGEDVRIERPTGISEKKT